MLTLTLILRHAWGEQPVLANGALQNQTKAILWYLQEDASTYGQRKHGYFVSGFLGVALTMWIKLPIKSTNCIVWIQTNSPVIK